MSLIECVPNFSEGRDKKTIDAIACAIQSVQDVQLLHTDIGYDANRTVFTFIGEPHNVIEAAYRSIKTASQLIDMRNHTGAHPRIGACDVCPIIPIHAIDIEACNSYVYELSHRLAELNIPVFLYEKSTNNTYRKHLEDIRKGEYEGLEIKMTDALWKADNDIKFNPKFGAMVLGVRNFLIAYNINLNTNDVTIAKKIAKKIRTSNNESITFPKYEKLLYLKSIGWYMEQYHCAQVSTNITDYNNTGLYEVFEAVKFWATQYGVEVNGSELIGMIPKKALLDVYDHISNENINENDKIDVVVKYLGMDTMDGFDIFTRILDK